MASNYIFPFADVSDESLIKTLTSAYCHIGATYNLPSSIFQAPLPTVDDDNINVMNNWSAVKCKHVVTGDPLLRSVLFLKHVFHSTNELP